MRLEEDTDTNNQIINHGKYFESKHGRGIDNSIREEIDEQFALKKSTSKSWDNEMEILDSIASRRLNALLNDELKSNEEIPTVKVKDKSKKRKIFFF